MKGILKKHIKSVITNFDEEQLQKQSRATPIDLFIRNYFKSHKSLGPNDRLKISDSIYSLIRYKDLLDYGNSKKFGWEKRIEVLAGNQIPELQRNSSISPWKRLSVPRYLYDTMKKDYGEDEGFQLLNLLNSRAPLTVRVNPIKTTREWLYKKWKAQLKFPVDQTKFSPLGLQFHSYLPGSLYELKEFEQGFFEIQDEGSQQLGQQVECNPGDLVLDFCAGSGGKTLTFGPFLKNTGQIYCHDIRKKSLINAKNRLERAGITNCQFHDSEQTLSKMYKKFDWVVVDVPCTGTGSLRRNPDIKWKFNQEYLEFNIERQKSIFDQAIKYVNPDGGRIVYMTCSILNAENQEQVRYFQEKYKLQLENKRHFSCMPTKNSHDGFFGAVMYFHK